MNPKISIVVPFHWMAGWSYFLDRCLKSIESQTYKNYEVILVKAGTMPVTSNRAIESARGELVKIIYMDDYLAHPDSLKKIVEHFPKEAHWMATGCLHQIGDKTPGTGHLPEWNDSIQTGNNTIGSPSVITLRRAGALFFDEKLSWLLDVDLYRRLYDTYGAPVLLNDMNVVIGLHEGQTSNLMPQAAKLSEHEYLYKKYE